jgi:long-subunit fatty acid transport protein
MYSNPAGLSFSTGSTFQLGGAGVFLSGDYSDSVNKDGGLGNRLAGFPEGAFVYHMPTAPISLGFSVIPDALAQADWQLVDKPGGLGATPISYGLQRNYAQFIGARGAFGASWRINNQLSVGADLGAEYNRDILVVPYTFQSYAPLRGFKTLLDLQTGGWGVNGTFGVVWRPVENVSLGLSYRSMTYFANTGDASGDAGAQLANIGAAAFKPTFHYDAEVDTKLPQIVSGGLSWQACDRVRLIGEADWVNWSGAFDHLNVKLKNGNNPDINGFLGTDHMEDVVPLDWKDSMVYRAGVEFTLSPEYMARLGYSYGSSPVPTSTLTPLSAAILEHTITCGLEWHRNRWTVAGAYQYDLPSTSNVGANLLAGGQFANSSTTVAAHWFGLTVGIRL